MYQQRFVP